MDEQPWVDSWPLFEEAYSKFPVLLDIAAAREKLARRFNHRPVRLDKATEIERAWAEHRGDA